MTTLDNFSQNYLRLTLEIDKHIDGYVDAYIGPESLKSAVQSKDKKKPIALADDLAWLQDNLPADPPHRRRYLKGVLRAMDCTIRILKGDEFDYLDEVNRLFDIRPQLIEEEKLLAVHRELDILLPGDGALVERVKAHRKRYEVETEQILPLLELARAETRNRTAELISLTDNESLEIKLTSNQPWGAYNWYLGNGRSLIEFNTDIPFNALHLLDIFAHEGYPGHHTEALLKEAFLFKGKGWGEYGVRLLNVPENVISEGIATTAVEIIFPGDNQFEWISEVILPVVGLESEAVEYLARLSRAEQLFRYVGGNAAILYHSGKLNREQTLDYYQTCALFDKDRAEKSFSFITHPLFRAYIFTYTIGYDLIAKAADGNKLPIFLRLLTEDILPSDIG